MSLLRVHRIKIFVYNYSIYKHCVGFYDDKDCRRRQLSTLCQQWFNKQKLGLQRSSFINLSHLFSCLSQLPHQPSYINGRLSYVRNDRY